jgi:sulfur carrier protein ThiS
MNITIEFIGFPLIYDLFPEGFNSYNFQGDTLADLICDLVNRGEPKVKESLLDLRLKALDPTIQIMINKKLVSKDKISEEKIKEGDLVTFMRLLAGG